MQMSVLSHYITGLSQIDEGHEKIMSTINDMFRCDWKELVDKIDEFIFLLLEDHVIEENLMLAIDYPYTTSHIENHVALMSQAYNLKKIPVLLKNKNHFFNDIKSYWLSHIDWFDIQLANYAKNLDNSLKI